MHLTHNEGKSVVAERFFRILKNKIYKYMTSVSKSVYTDILDDIVNKYNNTYHSTIKLKPGDVKSNIYIDSSEEIKILKILKLRSSDPKDPKLKIVDIVRISKYENILSKDYSPSCSEEAFVIKTVKNTVPWTYVINDLNGEELAGTFCKKELQKANQKEFRIEKVIKRKGDKLYVKWKGYNHSLNSWIDKKDIV